MKVLIRTLAVLAALWLLMTIFEIQVNTSQTIIRNGEAYPDTVAKDYGAINESKDSALVCSYFTGMRVVYSVYWYSPNNILGRQSCPIWRTDK